MPIEKDGFRFDFMGAKCAFDFDKSHRVPMKKVDIIAEFDDFHMYVEIRGSCDKDSSKETSEKTGEKDYKYQKKVLKYKYRDTYLYRHAENKANMRIHYVCLLTFLKTPEDCLSFEDHLKYALPVGKPPDSGWEKEIAHDCHVVNEELWRANEHSLRCELTKL